jgi:hypothetical protein
MIRSVLAVSIVLALASCAGTPRGGGGGGGFSDVTIGGGAAIPADDKQMIMPNLVGKTLDEAKKICKAAGFRAGEAESGRVEVYREDRHPPDREPRRVRPGADLRDLSKRRSLA